MNTALTIGIDVREWQSGTSTGIARVLTGFLGWATAATPHRFVLFGNQGTEYRIRTDLVETHTEAERSTLAWDQVLLPRMLRASGADVLLSPYYKCPLRAPCPVVVVANDLIELRYPTGSFLKRLVLPTWMRIMLGRATRVLTLSEFSRRDLMETLNVAPTRIGVISVAVDERFRPASGTEAMRATLERRGLTPGYVLYVGRCAVHKNVATLVHAWRALPRRLRDEHPLVLAGGEASAFRRLAMETDAEVATPGFIDDAELKDLYAGAAVMCFPSLYEGFGLPPLEAMACGTPVVAADATALPETLGDAALLTDPRDPAAWTEALGKVLQDADLRERLTACGVRRAARYTSEAAARALLENLEVAAGEKAR